MASSRPAIFSRLSSGPLLSSLVAWDRRHPALAIGTILVVALIIRLPYLSSRPLWFDEVYTFDVCHEPDLESFHAHLIQTERTPPLYYCLARICLQVCGPSDVALRLPALAAGLASIWVSIRLGRAGLGRSAGLVLALAIALSPLDVFYSREARAYSLGLFGSFLFLWAMLTFLRRPALLNALALAASGTVCVWSLYSLAVFVAIGMIAVLLEALLQGRCTGKMIQYWVIAGTLLAVATGVVIIADLRPQMLAEHATITEDFPDFVFDWRDPESLLRFFNCQPSRFLEYTVLSADLGPRWQILSLLALSPALVGIISALRTPGERRLVAVLALSSILAFVVLAGLGLHPFGNIRHCLALTALVLVLWAMGVERLGQSLVSDVACVFLFSLMIYGDTVVPPIKNFHDVYGMESEMRQRVKPEDVIVVSGEGACKVLGHYRAADPLLSRAIFSSELGSVDTDPVAAALRARRRIWLMEIPGESHTPDPAGNQDWSKVGTIVETIDLRGIRARVIVPR